MKKTKATTPQRHKWHYLVSYSTPTKAKPATCTRDGCGLRYYMRERPAKVTTHYGGQVYEAVYVLTDSAEIVGKMPPCGSVAKTTCPTCHGTGVAL